MEKLRPVAQYSEKDISPYFWVNGTHPRSPEFLSHLSENFKNYRLSVSGEVEQPREFSLEELRALPKQEQITQNYCIQGWSGIAKWGGVRLADLLSKVRPKPGAKYAVFYSFGMGSGPDAGPYYDCHKIEHLHHPQTILAYEMNGQPLQEPHGAPLRLRNELELGYKQVKWVRAVEFVNNFRHLGAGEGGFNEDQEYYGFRAPI
jgi:DMSO/TMAO reductase YedYZ molybdopterin-dependent catalytic subunit